MTSLLMMLPESPAASIQRGVRVSPPPAERIQLLESLLARLASRIDENKANPGEKSDGFPREAVPPKIVQLVGQVVIAASWTEDAAGMVLQASSGSREKQAAGYASTSNTLIKALKEVVPKELTQRLEIVMEIRHFLVHGVILDGQFLMDWHTGKPAEFIAIKRQPKAEAPERDAVIVTTELLTAVRDEFWALESEFEDLHARALFEGQTGAED